MCLIFQFVRKPFVPQKPPKELEGSEVDTEVNRNKPGNEEVNGANGPSLYAEVKKPKKGKKEEEYAEVDKTKKNGGKHTDNEGAVLYAEVNKKDKGKKKKKDEDGAAEYAEVDKKKKKDKKKGKKSKEEPEPNGETLQLIMKVCHNLNLYFSAAEYIHYLAESCL